MSGFSETMKRLRYERHMTQQEFADLLGTTKQNISRYEKGEVSPMIATAVRYAAALGITLEELNGEPKVEHQSDDESVKRVVSLAEQLNPDNLQLAADFLLMLLKKQ